MDHGHEQPRNNDLAGRKQAWARDLAERYLKAAESFPFEAPEDDGRPKWVRNVEGQLQKQLFPTREMNDEDLKSPKRLGSLIGFLCGYSVFLIEWIRSRSEMDPSGPQADPVPEGRVTLWFEAMREMAKHALTSVVDQDFPTMRVFLKGFADGFARKPEPEKPFDQGNSTLQIYVFLVMNWKSVETLESVAHLYKVLGHFVGAQQLGDHKRVEKICARIGLTFRQRGRPSSSRTK